MSEAVIGLQENGKNSLKILRLSRKTSAAPGQSRDIMAQIRVDALRREGLAFIMDIAKMLSGIDHIQIPRVSVRPVTFRLRRCVHHLLNGPEGLIAADDMTYDLPRVSAYYRYNVDIPRVSVRGLYSRNQYSSSGSTIFAPSAVSFFH